MSAIPDRYVCSGCGRYDLPLKTSLSSAGCTCPKPVERVLTEDEQWLSTYGCTKAEYQATRLRYLGR